eukprot:TRINITY_DN2842_c0_g3_i12.p1 TRINITY_DN2842_c0_g3~~TRINITY_DN2842_c0_g3_i12.p1  ORF type:complete len:184 (+),score=11.79 TRINITY_DN2842_c0_g3_i12:260-811(+)
MLAAILAKRIHGIRVFRIDGSVSEMRWDRVRQSLRLKHEFILWVRRTLHFKHEFVMYRASAAAADAEAGRQGKRGRQPVAANAEAATQGFMLLHSAKDGRKEWKDAVWSLPHCPRASARRRPRQKSTAAASVSHVPWSWPPPHWKTAQTGCSQPSSWRPEPRALTLTPPHSVVRASPPVPSAG